MSTDTHIIERTECYIRVFAADADRRVTGWIARDHTEPRWLAPRVFWTCRPPISVSDAIEHSALVRFVAKAIQAEYDKLPEAEKEQP